MTPTEPPDIDAGRKGLPKTPSAGGAAAATGTAIPRDSYPDETVDPAPDRKVTAQSDPTVARTSAIGSVTTKREPVPGPSL